MPTGGCLISCREMQERTAQRPVENLKRLPALQWLCIELLGADRRQQYQPPLKIHHWLLVLVFAQQVSEGAIRESARTSTKEIITGLSLPLAHHTAGRTEHGESLSLPRLPRYVWTR